MIWVAVLPLPGYICDVCLGLKINRCPVYPIKIPVTQQTLRSCALNISSFGLPRFMLGPEILTHSRELGTCAFMSMMCFLERQDAGLIEGYHWIEFSQRNDHNRSCNDQSK